MLGLLIKLGVALSHHSIGIWWALLIGFVLVYGGILLLTSDVIE